MLVLRDWDANDRAPCPAVLVEKVVGGKLHAPGLALRIAVRSLEAWLLADHEACASYFGIRPPRSPDELPDAKRFLVDACRRARKRRIREGVVPHAASLASALRTRL